jgi:hypothetical protein
MDDEDRWEPDHRPIHPVWWVVIGLVVGIAVTLSGAVLGSMP